MAESHPVSSTSDRTYPTWESLSSGADSHLVNNDTSLDPTLDFLRLQWDLSSSDPSEAVRVLEDAGDLQSSRTAFNQDETYAQSSICETPISAVTITVHELAEWQRIWRRGHQGHFYNFETTGENLCGCKPTDAPEIPTLTITASEGAFVTIGQYVREVSPWLHALEQRIRAAIGEFDDPLGPEWSLTPMPLINRVYVYNARPGLDLEKMGYVSKLRETVAQRKVHDREIEAQPSLVGATDRASLRPYVISTDQDSRMLLSLDFLRLQWCLSSDTAVPAVFVADDPADTFRAGHGQPFTSDNPIAAASIGERPVSAMTVSLHILDDYYESWDMLHYEDDLQGDYEDYDSKPRPRYKKRCNFCNQNAPWPDGPKLFIQAPSRYHFVTVGQYVAEFLPWLKRLEPVIRRAIVKKSQSVCEKGESLGPEWDVIPMPSTYAWTDIFYNEPRYGLQSLEGGKRRLARDIKERQEDAKSWDFFTGL